MTLFYLAAQCGRSVHPQCEMPAGPDCFDRYDEKITDEDSVALCGHASIFTVKIPDRTLGVAAISTGCCIWRQCRPYAPPACLPARPLLHN